MATFLHGEDAVTEEWRKRASRTSTLWLWVKSLITLVPWLLYIAFTAMIDETEIWHDELDKRSGRAR